MGHCGDALRRHTIALDDEVGIVAGAADEAVAVARGEPEVALEQATQHAARQATAPWTLGNPQFPAPDVEQFVHHGLNAVTPVDEHTRAAPPLVVLGREPGVRLAQLDHVIVRARTAFGNGSPVGAGKLQEVVKVAVPDPPAQIVRPDLIDRVAEFPKGRAGLVHGARGPGVRVRRHVRADEDSEGLHDAPS